MGRRYPQDQRTRHRNDAQRVLPMPLPDTYRRSTSSRLAVCLAVFAVYALTHRTSSLRFGRFPVIRIPTLYILAAIHVTATIDTPRIPSDSANS